MATQTSIEEVLKAMEKKGTPYNKLAPCRVCGCEYFYTRAGRKKGNGCVMCAKDKRDQAAQERFEMMMVDECGVKYYQGRSCGKCGSKTRIGENAYGTKKGSCRSCAIEAHEQAMYGKEMLRMTRAVSKQAHKFVVRSIERSGTVDVAPRTQEEYFQVRDLVERCWVLNKRNEAAGIDVRWEVGHRFPAYVAGELRGKATAENLFLIESRLNKSMKNDVPDVWLDTWVVSIGDVVKVKNAQDAAKAWKERKTWGRCSVEEQKRRDERERKANEAHKAAVKEVNKEAVEGLLMVLDYEQPRFEDLYIKTKKAWMKVVERMTLAVDEYTKAGRVVPYAKWEGQGAKLTMEALCGAQARLWIVVNTFEQLMDAEEILERQGAVDDQKMEQLKRYAVNWANDVLDDVRVEVLGFTHPLLEVLGSWMTWGALKADDGKLWICAWRKVKLEDQLTPFDDRPDDEFVNGVLKNKWKDPSETAQPSFHSLTHNADDIAYVRRAEAEKIARLKAEEEARKAAAQAQQEAQQRRLDEAGITLTKEIEEAVMPMREAVEWFEGMERVEAENVIAQFDHEIEQVRKYASRIKTEAHYSLVRSRMLATKHCCMPRKLVDFVNDPWSPRQPFWFMRSRDASAQHWEEEFDWSSVEF